MKKLISFIMAGSMMLTLAACGKSEAAKTVDKQINEIGKVTIESGSAISSAEAALKALSAEDKEQIDNEEKLSEARKAYDDLVLTNQAEEVVKKIDGIKEISLESLSVISEARKAYDKLSADAKAKVTNYTKLTDAEQQIASAKKAKAEEMLAKLRVDEDKVRNYKFYYPSSIPHGGNATWYADVRCFVLPYIGMDSNSAWLRLIYNYTEDDWIFFKSALFNIDGEQITRKFRYFDIVHDHDGGVVWEYIDTEGDYEVGLLEKIANSNETIVRFQGDDYSYDFTVPEKDKASIKEILEIFELLK